MKKKGKCTVASTRKQNAERENAAGEAREQVDRGRDKSVVYRFMFISMTHACLIRDASIHLVMEWINRVNYHYYVLVFSTESHRVSWLFDK